MYINDVTLQNINENRDDILQAIADTLGVSSAQISLNDLEEFQNGRVGVNVGYMNNVTIPDDFATKVEENLQAYTDFAEASVSDVGNAFYLQWCTGSEFEYLGISEVALTC